MKTIKYKLSLAATLLFGGLFIIIGYMSGPVGIVQAQTAGGICTASNGQVGIYVMTGVSGVNLIYSCVGGNNTGTTPPPSAPTGGTGAQPGGMCTTLNGQAGYFAPSGNGMTLSCIPIPNAAGSTNSSTCYQVNGAFTLTGGVSVGPGSTTCSPSTNWNQVYINSSVGQIALAPSTSYFAVDPNSQAPNEVLTDNIGSSDFGLYLETTGYAGALASYASAANSYLSNSPVWLEGFTLNPPFKFNTTNSVLQAQYTQDIANDIAKNGSISVTVGSVTMTIPATGPVTNVAPSNLTAATTDQQEGETNLSWTDNSSNETGFTVERALAGSSFTQIASLPANTTSYTDDGPSGGLPPETNFQYRVRAVFSNGTYSSYSNVASVTTLPPLPMPALTVTKVSNSNIALKWDITSFSNWTIYSSADITDYKIFRKLGANGTWSTIATIPGAQTLTFNDKSPVTGNLNFYGVIAEDTNASLSNSPVSGDWLGSYVDITPPAVPVLSLESFFMKNTLNGVTSYIPMIRINWNQSTDDNDNHNGHSFTAWGYNLYLYDTGGNKTIVLNQATFGDYGVKIDQSLYYNDGYQGNNDIASGYAFKVGSTYCYTASAYDISSLLAQRDENYAPQNTSAESAQQCITIPNPPSASAPTVSGVTGSASSFSVSGSNLSATGNSVILTPVSPTSMVPSSVLQANSYSAFDIVWNFLKSLLPQAHGQTTSATTGYGSYTIGNLSSANGTNLTFSVPTTVPNGTYKISVVNDSAIETDTTYTIVVSGHGSGAIPLPILGTTPTTTQPTIPTPVIPPPPSTTTATPAYSCPLGVGFVYTLTSGTNCTAFGQATKQARLIGYTCLDGHYTLVGTTCKLNGGIPSATTIPATTNYACPSATGFIYALTASHTCIAPAGTSVLATMSSYSCPIGYTRSGSTCRINTTTPVTPPPAITPTVPTTTTPVILVNPTVPTTSGTITATVKYTCPIFYALNTTTKTCSRGSARISATATYSCSSGYTLNLSAHTCSPNAVNMTPPTIIISATTTPSTTIIPAVPTTSVTIPATAKYSCGNGYALNTQNKCVNSRTHTTVSPTTTYTCPFSYTLNSANKTCTQQVSSIAPNDLIASAATSTSTASLWDVIVSWFSNLFH
jgi:hypothetical protein